MLISYPNIIYNNKEKLITEIEFIKYEGNILIKVQMN